MVIVLVRLLLTIDPSDIGGGTGAEIDVTSADVVDNTNTIVQITGKWQ